MSTDYSPDETYVLGRSPEEILRLQRQGQMYNPLTRRLLVEAGITKGMKVLDVGCGPGDVSLVAAELVGEEGSVLGVDSNADVLHIAQGRVQTASLRQVSFLAADLRDLVLSQEFDAIVGRLILQHLPDPVALLRRLTIHLRSGGLFAFQEYDLARPVDLTWPPSPLWEQALAWCIEATQRAGVEVRMGMKLHSTFLSAGLPAPQLRYEAAMGVGPEWVGYEWLADTVRVFLPRILQFGLATTEEVGLETLAERLREEIGRTGGVAQTPGLVFAWTRIGSIVKG